VALGIYISVPFCKTKCSYCNFASDVFSRAVFERYVDRVCADIANTQQIAEEIGGRYEHEADTIYLGGGTPTVLEGRQLQRIFDAVRAQFSVMPDAEVTVECAPGTVGPEVVDGLLRCGVNRVSLGVQSFVDAEAAAVGRLHKRSTVLDDIARLRAAGITNINVDLIAGLPHQTAESWQQSLDETLATGAAHVSVYMLEVDEDSRLGREVIAGGTRYHAHFVPDEEATADFYLAACEQLEAAGIAQYEISNFARTWSESRHNLKYWTRRPYLGFGVDAHSMLPSTPERSIDAPREDTFREGHDFSRAAASQNGAPGFSPYGNGIDAVRFSTADALEKYVAGSPLLKTIVSREAALEENLFLGLRLNCGVDLREVAASVGKPAIENLRNIVTGLVADELMSQQGDAIRLTSRGRLLSNEVFQAFLTTADASVLPCAR
jgi:oxygen-independent coproporphyrinogen-3 oxidase